MYKLPEEYKGELIVSFDCTKEYGKDEFFCTEGTRVVDSPLGKYLETSNKALSRFGYRFKIRDVSKPHMLIISYPDDKNRHMMINDCFSYDLSTGVFCGGEYEPSNKVQEIHHIFYTRTDDLTLTFTAWGEDEPAAAFGFAIYELEDLEDNKPDGNINFNTRKFGFQYEDPGGSLSDLGAMTFEDWSDKLLEYAQHTGQNMLVYPINWYAGPNYDSKVQPGTLGYWLSLPDRDQYSVRSTKPNDWISPFLDKCEEAGVEFVGGMTLLRLGNLLKNMNMDLDSIIAGADTYNNMRCDNKVQTSTNDWTIMFNPYNDEKLRAEGRNPRDFDGFEFIYGEKRDKFGGAPILNPLHPEVQRQVTEYFEEVAMRFGKKKAFKGISVNIWHATMLWFSSLLIGYDDYTVNLFTSETGIKVPCEATDPQRFQKRYEFLTRRNRKIWISWRCEKIHEFILKLRDAIRKYNPDLQLYLCMWNETVRLQMFGGFDESTQYPAIVNEYEFLKEGGIDLSLFEEDDGISISVEQNQHRDRGWKTLGSGLPEEDRHIFHDLGYMDDSWTNALNVRKFGRGAFVFDSWEEIWGQNIKMPYNIHKPNIDEALSKFKFENITFNQGTCIPEKKDDFWFESQRQITSCFPTGRNYLEPFAHAVAEFDPLYVLRGGLYLDKSHAAEAMEYASVYTKLPDVKFNTVEGNGNPVVVREINTQGKFCLYAVNREPYSVTVKIKLEKANSVCDVRTGKAVGSVNGEFEFVLLPFAIAGFVSDIENKVMSYKEIVPQEEIEKLEKMFNEQNKIFDYLKEKSVGIAGMQEVRQKLNSAYENKKYSVVRHTLKCYVSSKARQLYTKMTKEG